VGDSAATLDHHAELSIQLAGELGEPAGELWGHPLLGRYPSAVERLQGLGLGLLQTFGLTMKRLDDASISELRP